jgi:hypothetical protein
VKELIEYIAKSIVDHPEEVKVVEVPSEFEGETLFKLEVAADDKGKVIGRDGHNARATRTLLRATALRQDKRVRLVIP